MGEPKKKIKYVDDISIDALKILKDNGYLSEVGEELYIDRLEEHLKITHKRIEELEDQ